MGHIYKVGAVIEHSAFSFAYASTHMTEVNKNADRCSVQKLYSVHESVALGKCRRIAVFCYNSCQRGYFGGKKNPLLKIGLTFSSSFLHLSEL